MDSGEHRIDSGERVDIEFGPSPDLEASAAAAAASERELTIDDVEFDLATARAPDTSHTRGAPVISSVGLTDTIGRKLRMFTQVTDRYDTPEGTYVIAFMELLRLMVDRRIKGDPALLLNWLCLNIKHENQIYGFNQAQIVAETGIARPSISRALKILEQDHEILLRGRGRSVIWLNPRYFFKGSAVRQRKAAMVWDRLMAERPRDTLAVADALGALTSQNACDDMTDFINENPPAPAPAPAPTSGR